MKLQIMRIIHMVALLVGATMCRAQQPFDLDVSFRTSIGQVYVNSIVPMPDGKLLVSGDMSFSNGDVRYVTRLHSDGSRDWDYPIVWAGGGKMIPWEDKYYVMDGGVYGNVRRLNASGLVDNAFTNVSASPYVGLFQGGDYHVYPDGSVVITGSHTVNVPDSGWTGSHHMIWFNNDGTLDLTRRPRKGNGAIYLIVPQSDGKFLLSGASSMWEGEPVGGVFRVHADGTLDNTFTSGVGWGRASSITVLEDGRILASGLFKTEFSSPDTLHFVRLMPNGELDPTFNNALEVERMPWLPPLWPGNPIEWGQFVLVGHTCMSDGRIFMWGVHMLVEGQERLGMAMLDADGNLLDEPFGSGGCGRYYNPSTGYLYGDISGILEAPDGHIYIWGAYHGYDDGTTNDPTQRFVSRLYGLNVGVAERERTRLRVYPNPAATEVTVELEHLPVGGELRLRDALGRVVLHQRVVGQQHRVPLHGLPGGVYVLEVSGPHGVLATEKLIVQP